MNATNTIKIRQLLVEAYEVTVKHQTGSWQKPDTEIGIFITALQQTRQRCNSIYMLKPTVIFMTH